MKKPGAILMVAVPVLLAGCASLSPKTVAEPHQITLERALHSIGTGLAQMKQAEQGVQTGLVVNDITVTFDLTAAADDSGNLMVDLSAPIASGSVDSTASAGLTSKSSASRENHVTLHFVNLLTASPDTTVAGKKSPLELTQLLQTIKSNDLVTYRENFSLPTAPDKKP